MSTQRLTWTALPWGRTAEGRLRLSAYLSPRLELIRTSNPTLATDFPDFLDWPRTVNAARWELEVKGGLTTPAHRLSPEADSGLWRRLFPGTTAVRAFTFQDFSTRRLRSFPVSDVLAFARDIYREVARTSGEDLPVAPGFPGAHPTLARLTNTLGELLGDTPQTVRMVSPSRLRDFRGRRYVDETTWRPEQRALDFRNGPVPPFYKGSRPAFHFAAAYRFYDRLESRDAYVPEPKAALVPPPPVPPDYDFHQMLAILGDYPVLLRRLGLVIDLACDAELPGPGGLLRVVPRYGEPTPSPALPDFRPWTVYRVGDNLFVAEQGDADVADGMLRLDGASDSLEPGVPPLFDVVQIDPDGAALKLVDAAATLHRIDLNRNLGVDALDTPDQAGLPTLRSGGLAITRRERAIRLSERLGRAKDLDTQTDEDLVELRADALTRGYRLDIQRNSGPWRSVHWRRSRYTIGGAPVANAPGEAEFLDEGYIKGSSASSKDDKDSDLYVHETVARWSGWSLSAERPGRLPYPESSTDGDRTLQHESIEEKRPPILATQFDMIADHEVLPGSLPRLRFGDRYRLRARAVDLAGNSLQSDEIDDGHPAASEPVDYLRYEPVGAPELLPLAAFTAGESLARLVIRSNFDTHVQAVCERHLVPPKTSQFMAELHGVFDAAIGQGRPHDAAFAVALREANLLSDAPGTVKHAGGAKPEDWPADRDPPGTYYSNPQRQLVLPYLPDVLSGGASLRDLPGTSADAQLFDWGGANWPDARPFILRIDERTPDASGVESCQEVFTGPPPAPQWDPATRVLTVRLEKGQVAKVRYSSSLTSGALNVLGVWRWASGTADEERLARLAMAGCNWTLTPFRTLELVHAVRQPLCRPGVVRPPSADEFGFEGMNCWRSAGATFADLYATVLLSVRTTGLLDIDAVWTEPVDDKTRAEPGEHSGKAHVATIKVPAELPEGPNPMPFQVGNERLSEPVRHEFGDTKHRLIQYQLTGTTRFREYFAPEDGPITRTGDPVSAHIPSSARPDAPRVLYAVPTFGWTRSREPDNASWRSAQHVRSGGGLRVYVDRPWFSSGADELLGVVLWASRGDIPGSWRKLVSQIGRDPIWDTGAPGMALAKGDFAAAARMEDGLELAEQSTPHVSVVGYRPEWSAERGLWYADVLLPGRANASYFPFVRLALARYQHFSTHSGVKLSTVVPLDFAQLIPDRTLKVDWVHGSNTLLDWVDGSNMLLDVSLSGVGPDGPAENRVEVTLETHDGTVPGELGWRPWPDLEPFVLQQGLNESAVPHESTLGPGVREALDLDRRLRVRPGSGGRSLVAAIDPAHIPVVEATHALRSGMLERWMRVGERFPIFLLPGYRIWSGRLRLPVARGSQPLRLVIRELETYTTDAEAAGSSYPEPRIYHAERVVFADILEL